MNIIKNFYEQIKDINRDLTFDKRSFYLGTFFLSSALPISLLFFFISISRSIMNKSIYKINKYNFILLLSTGLMILSTLKSITNNELLIFISQLDKVDIIFGLFNWLPMYLFFVVTQKYLTTTKDRSLFGKMLIAGTIPVLLSCFLQYFFNVNGPFETLNGSIIWFQYDRTSGGVTGLFSNPNYTGFWLTILLPFLISEFKNIKKEKRKKSFLLILVMLTIFFIILTYSRNALVGLLITIFLFYGFKYLKLITIFSFFLFIVFHIISKLFFQSHFLENNLFINKLFISTLDFTSPAYARIEGYNIAIQGIFQRPIFGWGATIFPNFYIDQGGIWQITHSHNMLIELAFNYGFPVSILLTIFVSLLIINAFKKLHNNFLRKNIFTIDKAWITATFIVITSHLFDLTYYDGKISLLIWILLAGLKCIIDDKNNKDNISVN